MRNETRTFTVATTQDADAEFDETFTVSLRVSGTQATVSAAGTATGTITDDDSAMVTISDARALEGDIMTFTLTLDKAVPGNGFQVELRNGDDTAVEDVDYLDSYTAWRVPFATDTFTGKAGEQHTITVITSEDAVVEGNESFYLEPFVIHHHGLGNAPVRLGGRGTGTIIDDDSATVTVADASADEGDAMTFTVTLDKAVQGGLTATPGFTDGTATKTTDYTENPAGISFVGNAGETQTFTVGTTADADPEHDETFDVSLSVSGAPPGVTATGTATGTILDDDSAAVTIADASAAEGETLSFTVTLNAAVAGGLTVTPSFGGGTATKGHRLHREHRGNQLHRQCQRDTDVYGFHHRRRRCRV